MFIATKRPPPVTVLKTFSQGEGRKCVPASVMKSSYVHSLKFTNSPSIKNLLTSSRTELNKHFLGVPTDQK